MTAASQWIEVDGEVLSELVNGETGRPLFSAEDAERLDALMGIAYEVCDPCGVALRLVREPDSDPAQAQPSPAEPRPEVRESEYGGKIDVYTHLFDDARHAHEIRERMAASQFASLLDLELDRSAAVIPIRTP